MRTGAVLRYNRTTEPEIYHGTEALMTGRCGSPGTATIRNLSRKQARFAKTVTSLLTLLSVLGVGVFKIIT